MREPVYGRRDQFLNPESFDTAKAAELAERLETLHGSESEQAIRAEYLDLLDVKPGDRVLEVGCGNGWVLREIARRVGSAGRAVGLDASQELLTVARQQAEREGLNVDLRQGNARQLPFPDDEFDVVVAPLVLLHVPEVEPAVRELVRVAGPRGRVGVFERDNESFIINHPDRELTRRIIQVGTDETAINAWVGRALPGLFIGAGLSDVGIKPFTILERRLDGAVVRYVLRWADVAAELGAITVDERQQWLQDLQREEVRQAFLAGVTYFFAWGTIPAG